MSILVINTVIQVKKRVILMYLISKLQYHRWTGKDLKNSYSRQQKNRKRGQSHQLEVLLEDNITTRRNKARHYLSYVITIQRAWKLYVKRKQAKITSSNVTADTVKQTDATKESRRCEEFKNSEKVEHSDLLDENNICSVSRESTPDDRFSSQNRKFQHKIRSDVEVDSESISSDYSEVSAPLRDIAEAELQKLDVSQLPQESVTSVQKSPLTLSSQVERKSGESDEDFSKRLRKINLLSIAQEFAELKKLNVNALPFDLHKVEGQIDDSSPSASSSASNSAISSEMNTPVEVSVSFENMKNISNLTNTDLNSNTIHSRTKTSETLTNSTVNNIELQNSNPKNSPKRAVKNVNPSDKHCDTSEKEGDFDVFNIETAVPQMDWDGLEKQLQQATEEQKKRSEAQRNDREEIRRKLAMGTGVEEDYFSSERTYNKKTNLSSRLQSGMNLQICFMNESPGEEQNLTQDKISNEFKSKDEFKPHPLEAAAKDMHSDVNKNDVSKNDVKNGNSILPDDQTLKQEDGDFFKRQARLQREAKIALAQASTMAHMQLEVEKHLKKKSPIVDVVGIPYLNDLEKGQRFSKKILYEMNIAQLQVVVNDLHSQIESLNEDLVRFLMDRDELHMEQDSKLVDIEDLTRRAEERAGKVTTRQKKEPRKS